MIRNLLLVLAGLALTTDTTIGQPAAKRSDLGVYAIPYASESNAIELEVVNSTAGPLKDVSVQLGAVPIWLSFEETSTQIGALKAGQMQTATFTFDLDEKAPVGEITEVVFDVASAAGVLQSKSIKIEAEAPTELTLRGNYPNPFNPTTKIAYALPKDGNVEIEVFNAVGQRVTRIVDRVQEAGYREVSWNASTFPSGLYFYSIRLDAERAQQVRLGKMILVK